MHIPGLGAILTIVIVLLTGLFATNFFGAQLIEIWHDVLQRIPSAAGGLNTKVNNSGNLGNPPDGGGVGAGSATIDLRYLGANRTLVLVDGLRFVNGTSASGIPGSVDLNTIPINMIDRIEVLQAGASPLYGSDAIAGVVNVITVQQQRGLRASAQ